MRVGPRSPRNEAGTCRRWPSPGVTPPSLEGGTQAPHPPRAPQCSELSSAGAWALPSDPLPSHPPAGSPLGGRARQLRVGRQEGGRRCRQR